MQQYVFCLLGYIHIWNLVDAFALILKAVNAALEAHHVLQQIFDEAMTADSRVIA